MRLYYSATSPYVRKVMVVLHETDQLESVALVPASGTPLNAASMPLAQNPLGKVPTLERDAGPALYDSRVITRYLDSLASSALYPGGQREWEALTLEATGDGILDAALLMVYELRLRPDAAQMPELVEGHWDKIARALAIIEERWMGYLAGPFDIGQISIACALGYVDFRHDARNWRQHAPNLAKWYETVSHRPSLEATVPNESA